MDQIADENYQELWTFIRQIGVAELPDFVKSAELLDSSNNLHTSVFADNVNRRFPCGDPGQTYLSYMYFLKHAHEIPVIKQASVRSRLNDFVVYWNIEPECRELEQKFAKQAEIPKLSTYALVVKHNGKMLKKFPIRNEESVKLAARYLFDNKGSYPYEWRKLAAQNIRKHADKMNVKLDPEYRIYLEKAAGSGTAVAEHVAKKLCGRISLLRTKSGSSHVCTGLAKVAKQIIEHGDSLDHDMLEKTAAIIDAVDADYKFYLMYRNGLATPEQCCFGFATKRAEDILSSLVKLSTGSVYKLRDLNEIKKNAFEAALADDIVEELFDDDKPNTEKMAEILPTLPLTDASVLEKALIGGGVIPLSAEDMPADADDWD